MSHPYPAGKYDPVCDCAACAVAERNELRAELEAALKDRIALAREVEELRAEKLAREGQGAVDAVLLDDMVQLSTDAFGQGVFATIDCVQPLYLAAGAKPALVPMTGAEIKHALDKAHRKAVKAGVTNGGMVGETWNQIAARAIEAHHKIGVPK